jgi:hypothetical protein
LAGQKKCPFRALFLTETLPGNLRRKQARAQGQKFCGILFGFLRQTL